MYVDVLRTIEEKQPFLLNDKAILVFPAMATISLSPLCLSFAVSIGRINMSQETQEYF